MKRWVEYSRALNKTFLANQNYDFFYLRTPSASSNNVIRLDALYLSSDEKAVVSRIMLVLHRTTSEPTGGGVVTSYPVEFGDGTPGGAVYSVGSNLTTVTAPMKYVNWNIRTPLTWIYPNGTGPTVASGNYLVFSYQTQSDIPSSILVQATIIWSMLGVT